MPYWRGMLHFDIDSKIRSLFLIRVQPVKAGATKLESLKPYGYGSQLPEMN